VPVAAKVAARCQIVDPKDEGMRGVRGVDAKGTVNQISG